MKRTNTILLITAILSYLAWAQSASAQQNIQSAISSHASADAGYYISEVAPPNDVLIKNIKALLGNDDTVAIVGRYEASASDFIVYWTFKERNDTVGKKQRLRKLSGNVWVLDNDYSFDILKR